MLDTSEDETEMLSLMRQFIALCRRKPVIPVEGAMFHEILKEIRQMSDTFANELAQLQADVAAQGTRDCERDHRVPGPRRPDRRRRDRRQEGRRHGRQVAGVAAVRQGLEANTAALAPPSRRTRRRRPGAVLSPATPTTRLRRHHRSGAEHRSANTGTAPTGMPPARVDLKRQRGPRRAVPAQGISGLTRPRTPGIIIRSQMLGISPTGTCTSAGAFSANASRSRASSSSGVVAR